MQVHGIALGGPLRVLHVIDALEGGGAQRVLDQLVRWLTGQGVEVGIVGAAGGGFVPPPGVRVWRTDGRPTTVRVIAAAAEMRADVVHAHQRREALAALVAGKALRVPVVEHAHSVLPGRAGDRISFQSRRVYAVSPAVADMVTSRFGRPAAAVRIVRNIPAVPFVDRARPRRDDGPLRVLGIGRLSAQKDPMRFVAVIAHLSRARSVQAVWLGRGPLLDPAHQLARTLGAPVSFPGHTDGMEDEIDRSDALLMTSRWEGEPLAALEALARDVPVFSTAACNAPRLDGADEAVFPDESSAAEIAGGMMQAFDAPERMSFRTRELRGRLRLERTPDKVFSPILEDYLALRGAVKR